MKKEFRLSNELDRNKVFLVKHSELEGRFDPNFYNIDYLYNKNLLSTSRYKALLFRELIDVFKGGPMGFHLHTYDYKPTGVPVLRISNLKDMYVDIGDDFIFISREKHDELKNSQVQEGEIVLSKAGKVGRLSILPKEFGPANLNQALSRIRVNKSIIPEYLVIYFQSKLGSLQFKRFGSGRAVQDDLKMSEIEHFKVIAPPKNIQAQIVDKMDTAYTTKKQKEAEAQQLLDSIDAYLLGELGIELPPSAPLRGRVESTLKSRMFTRRLSEVSGRRFDAPIYLKKFILNTTKYQMCRFSDYLLINPFTSFHGYFPESFASFLPMDKVSDQYGEVDILTKRNIDESGGYTKFQNEDLVWAKITPCMQNGKSAVITDLENGIGFGSTEFHVFRAKAKVNIRYIHGLLRLRSLRKHAVLYFSGSAGHQRVSDEFFRKLEIPLPPIEKQNEIADHITKIRDKAKRLRQEAKDGLEHAKKEVEAMILGKDESKDKL